jgi:hypothetical protein
MKTPSRIAICAGSAWLLMATVGAAQVLTPVSLLPCAFKLDEVAQAMGMQLDATNQADMTTPVGRDVGCLYSIKGSDFVFGVRQTWDSTRLATPGPPTTSPTPTGGQLVYVVGKIQITVFWHGGTLASADGLRRLLKLRRLP